MAAERKTRRRATAAPSARAPKQSPAQAKQAILVLGMHRSGTSALTRVLSLMGADLPKNLMGPGVGNDTGHWESNDLVAIHDDMLASAGTSWADWRAVNPDWISSAEAEAAKQRLLAVLGHDYAGSSLFVIKDPRICRFVPLWLDLLKRFGAAPVPILPIRNPLEVAASLRRRDGFPLTKSYLLWLRHVLDAEHASRGLPRAIVTYDMLMDDWRAAVSRISTSTGLRWPRRTDSTELAADRFLADAHRHHLTDETQLNARADVADWVKSAYGALLAMSRDLEQDIHRRTLDQIRAEFEKAAAVFGLLVAGETEDAETRIRDTQILADTIAHERDTANALRAERDIQLAETNDALAQARQLAADQAAHTRSLNEDLIVTRGRANKAESDAAAARQEAERRLQELESTRLSLKESQTETQILSGEVGHRQQLLDEARLRLETLSAERDIARTLVVTSETALTTAQASVRDTVHQLQVARRELDATREALRDTRQELGTIHNLLRDARHERDLAVAALRQAQHAAQDELHHQTHLADKLASADKIGAAIRAELQNTREERDSLRRKADESGRITLELAQLQDRIRKTQAQAQQEIAAREHETARLQREIANARKETQTLRLQQADEQKRNTSSPARRGFWSLSRLWRRSLTAQQRREMDVIQCSGLFDALWYLNRYPDVSAAGQDPLTHYVLHGGAEGRDPHPLFDGKWYIAQYPNHAASKLSPLGHYVIEGAINGCDPNPLFDTDWYLQQHPDAAAGGLNPLRHFWTIGTSNRLDPNVMFKTSWYLENNPDVERANENALAHYRTHGWKEKRDPHPQFSATQYLTTYDDVAAAQSDPLEHYLLFGMREGRSTSPSLTIDQTKAPSAGTQTDCEFDDSAPIEPQLLPRRLLQLLDMFHDRSTGAMLDECYDLIAKFDGFEISEDAYKSTPELVSLVQKIRTLAKGHSEETPQVSIIVPVHNKFLYTACCIYSLLSTRHSASFEIILADDCSTDATSIAFAGVGGTIRYLRNTFNLGFLRNCNSAAKAARGRFFVFLNNDTFILPNWLDELIAPFEPDDSIGLTGSKLLNVDGSLQEAGGIVWRDASAWNFGRGDDACAPQYNYVKDADYISGASIAIRATLWRQLSGFDEIYVPAYFEDTDLAFRVRQSNMRVVYCPLSAVVHHEGISHGRDTSSGIKTHQETNRIKFRERWRSILERQHFPNSDDILWARDRSHSKPRILIVDHYIPQQDRDAGSRSMFHYIELFSNHGFHITFWPHNRHFDRPYAMHLQSMGVEVIYGYNDIWPEFGQWLAANNHHLKYAFLSRPSVAKEFIDFVRNESTAKILFYGHDIHFRRLLLEHDITRQDAPLEESKRIEIIERDIWAKSDVVYYPSKEEENFVKEQAPMSAVQTLPLYIYDKERLAGAAARIASHKTTKVKRLIFIGGFRHKPNVDAVVWFHELVWPIVLAEIPDVEFIVAGSSPPPAILDLAAEKIRVTGEISDTELADLYENTSAAVAPLRFGAGMKGKVLEALSYGVPLVTTKIGIQGLDSAIEFCCIADSATEFAEKTIDILQNPTKYLERSKNGLSFIQAQFSLQAARSALREAIPELGQPEQTIN